MKNSVLISNYSKLSKVYLNRFTLFVASPYFNKQETVINLHKYLLKQYPSFNEKNCSKELVYIKVFGKEKFKLQKLKDVNASLLDLFEQFLVNEALKKDKASFRRLEIQECFDNTLDKMSKKIIKIAFKELDKLDINQSKKYHYQYILNDFAYTYQVYYGDRKNAGNFLQISISNLDKFYFTEKMLLGASIINRQKIVETDFKYFFFNEVDTLITKNKSFFKNDKAILLNQQLYLLQKEDNIEYYYSFKNLVINYSYNRNETRIYYSFLTNFCVRMINAGKPEFLKELFILNKNIIERNLLLENNILSEWSYKNIIAIALRLKEFDWVDAFIEKYSKNLSSKNFLNAYNYNKANVAYYKKDYNMAFDFLLNVKYNDVFYLLSSKALLLKIYYESKDYDVLESLLHSFRLLVMRQKISTKQKDAYFNLIKTTSFLLKIRMKISVLSKNELENNLLKLSSKINKYKTLANKTWLNEIIKDIRKKIC